MGHKRMTPGTEGADADVWQINDLSLTPLRDLCSLSSYYRPLLFCFDQTEFYGSDKVLRRSSWQLHRRALRHHTPIIDRGDRQRDKLDPRHSPKPKPANQARFSTAVELEEIDTRCRQEEPYERLEGFSAQGFEYYSQFLKATWLSSQFSPQPNIGVRHLLVRAAEQLRTLAKAPARPSPPMAEVFAIEIDQGPRQAALHQYNQDCLMWFTQVLSNGFDSVTVKKPKNRYFSTQWEWKDRVGLFRL